MSYLESGEGGADCIMYFCKITRRLARNITWLIAMTFLLWTLRAMLLIF